MGVLVFKVFVINANSLAYLVFRLVPIVQLPVSLKVGGAGELLETYVARVGSFTGMRPIVQLQTSGIVENLGARGTPERVLVAMDSIVSFQRRSVEKRLGADIAFVGFFVAFVN